MDSVLAAKDMLVGLFGTYSVCVKCKNFVETVEATNILMDMGFSPSEYAEKISKGNGVEEWRHPFITHEGIIHYYSKKASLPYKRDRYNYLAMFDELANVMHNGEEDNINPGDVDILQFLGVQNE